MSAELDVAGARAAALALAATARAEGRRIVLGLAGPPGAGKSTLAAALVAAVHEEWGDDAAVGVGMDGYHLAQAQLELLGRARRKGAPDTFDAAGFVALLRRIVDREPLVYAPAFDRHLEEPIAGAVAVPGGVGLVVVEGNYLLLDGEWAGVRPLLDVAWHLRPDPQRRVAALIARHVAHGRSEEAATEWVHRNDESNAALVEAAAARADAVVVPW